MANQNTVKRSKSARRGKKSRINEQGTRLSSVFGPTLTVAPSFGPGNIRRTLRYTTGYTSTGTSGALAATYFRAIGLYDPEYAVGGHQPMGFDQYIALYRRFVCLSSRITVEVYNQTGPVVCGIQLVMANSSPYTTYAQIIEQGQCVHRLIPDNYDIPFALKLSQRTASTFSVVDPLDDFDLSGSNGADPARPLQFMVWNQDPNLTSTSTVQFVITIEYDTIFMDPQAPAAS